jgi:hypothetical protein
MPPKKNKKTVAADGVGATAEELRFEDVEDNFTEIAVYMDSMRQRDNGVASRFLPVAIFFFFRPLI